MAANHLDTTTTTSSSHHDANALVNGVRGIPVLPVSLPSSSRFNHIPLPDSPLLSASVRGRPPAKYWERSLSAVELDRPSSAGARYTSTSTLECSGSGTGTEIIGNLQQHGGGGGNSASEQATVFWDLSTAGTALTSEDDSIARGPGPTAGAAGPTSGPTAGSPGGKFKISLQTIHQKEHMTSSGINGGGLSGSSSSGCPSSPNISFQTHYIRRMSSETSVIPGSTTAVTKTECSEISLPVEFPFPIVPSSGSVAVQQAAIAAGSIPSLPLSGTSSPRLPPPGPLRMQSEDGIIDGTVPPKSLARLTFTYNNSGSSSCASLPNSSSSTPSVATSAAKSNLTATLATAVPAMRDVIKRLRSSTTGSTLAERCQTLREMLTMIESAWSTPSIGRDVAYALCDVLRTDGGLDALLGNCDVVVVDQHASGSSSSSCSSNAAVDALPRDVQLGSARVLAESMTVENRDYVARGRGLEIVVRLAGRSRDDPPLSLALTGILESLFKHSQVTCAELIRRGGLDSVLYSCRRRDVPVLRRCAVALANLAIYGGPDNQQAMIEHRAAEWLFPLAFSNDDSTRYYAFLAIATLSANPALEAAVVRSGTLGLVEPFIRSHDPAMFGRSDNAHMHGQSSDWLRRFVPLLGCGRIEAQSLAAFHFAMEAAIRVEQGKVEVFNDINAIEPLKRLASGTDPLAARFAAQALHYIGEEVPHKLSQQVPLWTTQDVVRWLRQLECVGDDVITRFEDCGVDGDLLLTLRDEHLREDLAISNGVLRLRFNRDLVRLKQTANYESCDPTRLDDWLHEIGGRDLRQYTYQMLKSGVDRRILRSLNDEHLQKDCGVLNGVHRWKIIDAAKRISSMACSPLCVDGDNQTMFDKPIDVFISYRRSTGSQLASLLKVHLQLRGLTVFLDIEKLRAGKFDDNLLSSVHNARNFILVLTPNSLDRCVGDLDRKDWVHREVVAALEGGCNIIPVMDNFQWPSPETLPEDMRPICYFNSIRWIHDYQDACVDKLENFVTGGETSGSSASRAVTSSASLFRPSMSKASSLTSPTPEMHGPMCPLPVVCEGPQIMSNNGAVEMATTSNSILTSRPAVQTARTPSDNSGGGGGSKSTSWKL